MAGKQVTAVPACGEHANVALALTSTDGFAAVRVAYAVAALAVEPDAL